MSCSFTEDLPCIGHQGCIISVPTIGMHYQKHNAGTAVQRKALLALTLSFWWPEELGLSAGSLPIYAKEETKGLLPPLRGSHLVHLTKGKA